MTTVLSRQALNRALLERQLLLERRQMSIEDALEHLVGMQAQAPLAPYVGLWSRLDPFDPDALSERVLDRRAVRAAAMLRGTIHLLTARDAVALRPVLQEVLERAWRSSPFFRNLQGLDLTELLSAGREALEERPLSVAEMARRLVERWPDRDPSSLSYTVRYLVPLVQVPPRGVWGATGPATLTTLETWVGRRLEAATEPDAFVLRYLAAFGPATVADIATWSWLTGVRDVVERLRPDLRTFRDEQGRELVDVPDAPLPDPATPAPTRFLPEYDNALLSHADRTRIVPAGRKVPLPPGSGGVMGTMLIDGYLCGTWRIIRDRPGVTLTVEPDRALTASERESVETEGDALLRFSAPDTSDRLVRVVTPA